MFLINLNKDNVITAYSTGDGYVEGYVEVDKDIPEDFAPNKYMYVDGEYVLNPDYVDPTDEPTSDNPTSEEILNVLLGVSE